jgi:signal peptidase I
MKRLTRAFCSAFFSIGAGVTLVLAVAFLSLPLLGLKPYVITGASMTGTIGKGALILDRAVPVGSLKVGDIITFLPPNGTAQVTHRIIAIDVQQDGTCVFSTKGDFNTSADPWQMILNGSTQAKYVAQIPHAGYAFAVISLPLVRRLLLWVPVALLALSLLYSLWTRPTRTSRRRAPVASYADGAGGEDPWRTRRTDRRR